MEVEQELDDVLNGLSQSARRDPRRYGALWALVQREREELRGGRGFFPHTAAVRDRGIEVVPVTLRQITGGYGGARCMTCVLDRSSS